MTQTQPIPHPELEQLRQRCRYLQEALRQTVQEYVFLRTELYPKLQAEYERHFRGLEQQLQYLSLHAAQLRRQLELLWIKVQRGEPITEQTLRLIEQIVAREFSELWERLRAAHSRQSSHQTPSNPTERGKLLMLYRQLVKRLHPDAVGAETEAFHRYWALLQRAYRERNLQQLRQLALLLCEDTPTAEPAASPQTPEALRRYVCSLERRLAVERQRLERLRAEEPFYLPLTDPSWLAQRRRELEEELRRRQQDIALYSAQLSRLREQVLQSGSPTPPHRA